MATSRLFTLSRTFFTTNKQTLANYFLSRSSATKFSLLRLRPLASTTVGGLFRSPATTFRSFSTRQSQNSLSDNNPNWSNRPPTETILLDGCDFEHWLVVVEPPPESATRDEIIDSYIKTLAQVIGSEEEARMKIYSVSTGHYFAFGALVSEELSLKLKELPNVRWVLPDSYLDVKHNDYGGEPFINGQAVPYEPKYHEELVRNNAKAQERSRRNDRPRNADRSRNFDRRQQQPGNPSAGPGPAPAPAPAPNMGGPSNYPGGPPPNNARWCQNTTYFPKVSPLHNGLRSAVVFPHCGMSTFATPDKEQGKPAEKNEDTNSTDGTKQAGEGSSVETEASEQSQGTGLTSESQPTSQNVKKERCSTKRTAFSDSESDVEMDDLSREDLVKLVFEKEGALSKMQEEYKELKDTYLRSYAEMENRMERTRREAENSKKFAVQSFAKSLLDVADNLGRASSVTKESFNKIDASEDSVGAVPLLKSLMDGVEMTEKQLADVLRKAGIEKYDPSNEQFDPNRHNAVFQVPDNSKPPGTVAVVLKAGYTLHDRIIRPAEVGVTVAIENEETNA